MQEFLHVAADSGRFSPSIDFVDSYISPPIDCYTITLNEISPGTGINGANYWGTRYYFLSRDRAEVEVDVVTNGGIRMISSIHQNAISARAAMRAINVIALKPPSEECELRLLIIHEAPFIGVWLHGKEDVLIPIEPTSIETVRNYEPYSEEVIFDLLKSACRLHTPTLHP